MCDCLETIRKELTKRAEEKVKDHIGFKGMTSSYFTNEVLLYADGAVRAPFVIPFIAEYKRESKKSGKIRDYKEKMNFIPAFCPVCGVNYAKEEYKRLFIKYIIDLGIELHMAESELEGHLESQGDDLDMSDPEDDARECMSYWDD